MLARSGVKRVISCGNEREASKCIADETFHICYIDLMSGREAGMQLAQRINTERPDVQVLTGCASCNAHDVVAAMRVGVSDFIIDPFDAKLLAGALERAIQCVNGPKSAPKEKTGKKSFLTQDSGLLGVLAIAKKVAPSSATVLITGESGTGKEVLASFIHTHSRRDNHPFVAVNCAALPEQLAESELFGHEKGAFTGAIGRKIGKFEGARDGTLVLDEVTEMALALQAKLLRALQEKEIVRIGSNRPTPVNARVIAISNQNVRSAVESGAFREDLFFRLNVIPLTIPPLRERKGDISLLAEHFFNRFSRQNDSEMQSISPAAMDLLNSQTWSGNVRELENTIERGVLIGSGDTLLPDHLMLDPIPAGSSHDMISPPVGVTVKEMEKELIHKTLASVDDNRTHAAKMLGISIRTLRNKLNEYRRDSGTPPV